MMRNTRKMYAVCWIRSRFKYGARARRGKRTVTGTGRSLLRVRRPWQGAALPGRYALVRAHPRPPGLLCALAQPSGTERRLDQVGCDGDLRLRCLVLRL